MLKDDRLIYLVFTAQQKLRTYLKNAFSEAGVTITPAQSGILFLLKKKNGQTMSELTQVLSLDNSTLTGLVDRLERAGFVKRNAGRWTGGLPTSSLRTGDARRSIGRRP